MNKQETSRDISKIKTRLTARYKDRSWKSPLGLCNITRTLRGDGKIKTETYDLVKAAIRDRAEQQTTLWDAYGYEVNEKDQFLWGPNEYKKRWEFLDNLQKQLK